MLVIANSMRKGLEIKHKRISTKAMACYSAGEAQCLWVMEDNWEKLTCTYHR